MTTGRAPLLDSLRANNRIQKFFDHRSGSLRSIIGNADTLVAGGAAGLILQRNGLVYTGAGGAGLNMTAETLYTKNAGAFTGNGYTTVWKINTNNAVNYSNQFFKSAATAFNLNMAYVINNGFRAQIVIGGTTISTTYTGASVISKDSCMMATYNYTTKKVRLFLNGTFVAEADYSAVAAHPDDTITTDASLSGGGVGSVKRHIYEGLISQCLTDAEVATLYDELDNQLSYENRNLTINKDFGVTGTSVWEARYGLLAGETTMSAGQTIGQLEGLKAVSGTHKATTFLFNGVLAKGIQCVTAGNIIIPDPRPALGTTFGFWYYTAATASWAWVTQASTTIAMGAAGDRVLWATANGQNCLRKY